MSFVDIVVFSIMFVGIVVVLFVILIVLALCVDIVVVLFVIIIVFGLMFVVNVVVSIVWGRGTDLRAAPGALVPMGIVRLPSGTSPETPTASPWRADSPRRLGS